MNSAATLPFWSKSAWQTRSPSRHLFIDESTITEGDDLQPPIESSPEVAVSDPAPALDAPSPDSAPPVTNFSRTNGKVFFRNVTDGLDYVCSGSAINSGSRRLVSTAGHCVHGGPDLDGGPDGTWHQNWIFVPHYNNNTRPYGMFQAYQFRTFNDWINYGETGRGFNSDVAFVTTYTNASGQRVVDAVGGHGLITGGNQYVFDVSFFGYPGNLNNGQVMWACWGRTGTRGYDGYDFSTISGCEFGPGASGGPWLRDYSNATGLGYIKTISAWVPRNSVEHINGPFFRPAVETMFHDANAAW